MMSCTYRERERLYVYDHFTAFLYKKIIKYLDESLMKYPGMSLVQLGHMEAMKPETLIAQPTGELSGH